MGMLQDIQKEEIKILSIVIEIFKKYNLRYYAIGGTCIGAVRHHGFIPWDDDIDIAMPRKDFEFFKRIAPDILPEKLELKCNDKYRGYSYFQLRVHNTDTAFVESYIIDNADMYTGIYIEIMPMDGIPLNPNVLRNKMMMRQLYMLGNWALRAKWKDIKKASAKAKLVYLLFFPLRQIIPFDMFSKKIDKLFLECDFDESERILFSWRRKPEGHYQIIFPRRLFELAIEVPFENISISIPAGYKEYLSRDFGDYMKLPPEEERVSGHDMAFIDLKNSYKSYLKKECVK